MGSVCFVTVSHDLTVFGPGLDGHRTVVKGERVVKQVDLAVDLCVYDDTVLDGAVPVHQQVLGAVLHVGCDAAQGVSQKAGEVRSGSRD